MSLLRQPKAVWLLSFTTMWDTFSYYATQTFLTLYVIHMFRLSRHAGYEVYGAYAALAYALPLFGGLVADRWLGSMRAVKYGLLMNILGNLFLMSLYRPMFCLGLSVSLIGSGLYKSSATHLVGALYENDTHSKEQGFTLFYLATNIGGTLGPIIYGVVAYKVGWNYSFLASAIVLFAGYVWFVAHWRQLKTLYQPLPVISCFAGISLAAMVFILAVFLSVVFYFPVLSNPVLSLIFLIALCYLIIIVKRYQGKVQHRLYALLFFCFFAMFYFSIGFQTGTTITLFLQEKVHQGLISIALPASSFNMLYSLFVLVLAPFVAYGWRLLKRHRIILSLPWKLILSLSLAALGIGCFALASFSQYIISPVVFGYLLLSAGELVIMPIAYTAVSQLTPSGIKSTMMGGWLLFIALGGYLSSLLSRFSHTCVMQVSILPVNYGSGFMVMSLFTLFIILCSILVMPLWSKWLA